MASEEKREKARLRSEAWRRAHGIMPRKPAQRPWIEAGCNRSTWYRRRAKAREQAALAAETSRRREVLARAEFFVARLQAELAEAARCHQITAGHPWRNSNYSSFTTRRACLEECYDDERAHRLRAASFKFQKRLHESRRPISRPKATPGAIIWPRSPKSMRAPHEPRIFSLGQIPRPHHDRDRSGPRNSRRIRSTRLHSDGAAIVLPVRGPRAY